MTDGDDLVGRREFLITTGAAAAVLACAGVPATRDAAASPSADQMELALVINGEKHSLRVDPRTTLLDLLRENLGLTGTKKGCDMGQCGACTVLVDDRRVNSCLMLAAQADGRSVVTIEGLSSHDGALHPVQQAFLEEDAFQCGYCTPGQILSCVGFLREGGGRTEDEIREGMSGNICRCGAYPNIVAAVRRSAG
ncbi:MAG TPA: (2Fe-2S)-binding protein [Myxococcales bacterium]|nr:(2Fe-2S)-binding protein [Myxococcales bacterium]